MKLWKIRYLSIYETPMAKLDSQSLRTPEETSFVVLGSPVSRPEKDRQKTGLNWKKDRTAGPVFWFLRFKTAKRPVLVDRSHRLGPVFCSPIYSLQNAPKNVLIG